MGLYKYVKNSWQKPSEEFVELQRKRLVEWRSENATTRIEKPTRIDKARAVGYRAKQGVIVVRQRVERGGRTREKIRKSRRTAHRYGRKILSKNYQQIAEERANDKFHNCEVLNSYPVGQDGVYAWYEVILLDKTSPVIQADDIYKNIISQRGRVYRGVTAAGRRARGMLNKGLGAEKIRPSVRANHNRGT